MKFINFTILAVLTTGVVCTILRDNIGVAFIDVDKVYISSHLLNVFTDLTIMCPKDTEAKTYLGKINVMLANLAILAEVPPTTSMSSAYTVAQDRINMIKKRLASIDKLYNDLEAGRLGLENLEPLKEYCSTHVLTGEDDGIYEILDLIREQFLYVKRLQKKEVDGYPPNPTTESPFRPTSVSRFSTVCPPPSSHIDDTPLAKLPSIKEFVRMSGRSRLSEIPSCHDFFHYFRLEAVPDWPVTDEGVESLLDIHNSNLETLARTSRSPNVSDDNPDEDMNSLWDEVEDENNVIWQQLLLSNRKLYEDMDGDLGANIVKRQTITINQGDRIKVVDSTTCTIQSSERKLFINEIPYTILDAQHGVETTPAAVPAPPLTPRPKSKSPRNSVGEQNSVSLEFMKDYNAATMLLAGVLKKVTSVFEGPALMIKRCAIGPGESADPYDAYVSDKNCKTFLMKDDESIRKSPIVSSLCSPSYQNDDDLEDSPKTKCDLVRDIRGECEMVMEPSIPTLSPEDQETLDHLRTRRGLGDFVMDKAWKPLFGAASESDIEKVVKIAKKLNSNQNGLYKDVNNIWTYLRSSNEVIDSLKSRITSTGHEMVNWANSLKSDIADLRSALSNITDLTLDLAVLVKLNSGLSSINELITSVEDPLRQLRSIYRDIAIMINTEKVSTTVFSHDFLQAIVERVRKHADQLNAELPPGWLGEEIFKLKVRTAIMADNILSLVLDVPLVHKGSEDTESLALFSFPIRSINFLTYVHEARYIILDKKGRHKYMALSEAEYDSCKSQPASVCPFPGTWVYIHDGDCLSSLISPESSLVTPASTICKMQAIEESSVKPRAIYTAGNVWVVHPGKDKGDATFSCNINGTESTTTREVTDMSMIYVDPQCFVDFKNIRMSPIINLEVKSRFDMKNLMVSPIAIPGTGDSLLYQSQDTYRQRILSISQQLIQAKRFEGVKLNDMSLTELDAKVQSMKALLNNKTVRPKEVITDDEFNWRSISFLESLIDKLPWWTGPGAILGIVLVIILICLKYLGGSQASHLMPAVAFSKIPTVSASAMSNVTQATKNFTMPIPSVMELGSTLREYLLKVDWDIWMMIIMSSVMVVLMVIHHCSLASKLKRITNDLMRRQGFHPLNVSATHISNERPVLITLMFQCEDIIARASRFAATFQLTTLPGHANDWYVKENVNQWLLIKPVLLRRWERYLNVPLDWTRMCILNRKMSQLDICEDMPSHLKISLSKLRSEVNDTLPFFWWKAQIIGIAQLSVAFRNGTEHILYAGNDLFRD